MLLAPKHGWTLAVCPNSPRSVCLQLHLVHCTAALVHSECLTTAVSACLQVCTEAGKARPDLAPAFVKLKQDTEAITTVRLSSCTLIAL